MFVNILIWFACGLIFGGFCMPLADKKGYSAMPVEEKKDE